jgi:hypothetical protein
VRLLSKGMAAFLESVNENRLYCVTADGTITTMSWDEYEAMADDDPRMDRIFSLFSSALRLRNRTLGVDLGALPN